MKKKILLGLLLLWGVAQAGNLTDYQKQKVREVVSSYCNLISQFAQTEENADNRSMQIINLFSNENVPTYNDLTDQEVMFFDYLSTISSDYNHSLTFSFKENINNQKVYGLTEPSFTKTKELIYAEIEMTKTILGEGLKKTIKNVFVVNLKDYKIWGITSTSNETSPYELWLIGIQAYNKKQYSEALEIFEKCANNRHENNVYVILSQYYTGVMYLKKEGCKHFKKKVRDKKGVEWLRKASIYYSKARQDLDRLGDY